MAETDSKVEQLLTQLVEDNRELKELVRSLHMRMDALEGELKQARDLADHTQSISPRGVGETPAKKPFKLFGRKKAEDKKPKDGKGAKSPASQPETKAEAAKPAAEGVGAVSTTGPAVYGVAADPGCDSLSGEEKDMDLSVENAEAEFTPLRTDTPTQRDEPASEATDEPKNSALSQEKAVDASEPPAEEKPATEDKPVEKTKASQADAPATEESEPEKKADEEKAADEKDESAEEPPAEKAPETKAEKSEGDDDVEEDAPEGQDEPAKEEPAKKDDEEAKGQRKREMPTEKSSEYPGGPILLEGELLKQGVRGIKSWKKRRFVLQNSNLRYFDRNKETGLIEVSSISEVVEKKREKTPFDFDIVTTNRSYHLRAASEETRDYWINGLRKYSEEARNSLSSQDADPKEEKTESKAEAETNSEEESQPPALEEKKEPAEGEAPVAEKDAEAGAGAEKGKKGKGGFMGLFKGRREATGKEDKNTKKSRKEGAKDVKEEEGEEMKEVKQEEPQELSEDADKKDAPADEQSQDDESDEEKVENKEDAPKEQDKPEEAPAADKEEPKPEAEADAEPAPEPQSDKKVEEPEADKKEKQDKTEESPAANSDEPNPADGNAEGKKE